MRYCVLDPHLYEKVKDDPGLILSWDPLDIADRVYPRKYRDARKRNRLKRVLPSAMDAVKTDLFAK